MKITKETFLVQNSWEEAVKNSVGYQNPILVKNLTRNLIQNPPWKNIDAQLLNSRIMELMAAVLFVMRGEVFNSLCVADIGGGNGYMGIYIQKLMPDVKFNWIVYESPEISKHYSNATKEQNFIKYKSINDLFIKSNDSNEKFNIILLSCSLQYLEKPYQFLEKLQNFKVPKIIMRIPFVDQEKGVITIQNFSEVGGYSDIVDISWPAWFFSKENFMKQLKINHSIKLNWLTDSESVVFNGKEIIFEGIVCH